MTSHCRVASLLRCASARVGRKKGKSHTKTQTILQVVLRNWIGTWCPLLSLLSCKIHYSDRARGPILQEYSVLGRTALLFPACAFGRQHLASHWFRPIDEGSQRGFYRCTLDGDAGHLTDSEAALSLLLAQDTAEEEGS